MEREEKERKQKGWGERAVDVKVEGKEGGKAGKRMSDKRR